MAGKILEINLCYLVGEQDEGQAIPLDQVVKTGKNLLEPIGQALDGASRNTTLEGKLEPRGMKGVHILEWYVQLSGYDPAEVKSVLDRYLSAVQERAFNVSYNCKAAKEIAHSVMEAHNAKILDRPVDVLIRPFNYGEVQYQV